MRSDSLSTSSVLLLCFFLISSYFLSMYSLVTLRYSVRGICLARSNSSLAMASSASLLPPKAFSSKCRSTVRGGMGTRENWLLLPILRWSECFPLLSAPESLLLPTDLRLSCTEELFLSALSTEDFDCCSIVVCLCILWDLILASFCFSRFSDRSTALLALGFYWPLELEVNLGF